MPQYSLADFLNIKSSFFSSFSPDDKRVCFLDNTSGVMQVYTGNTDGSDVQQVTDYGDSIQFACYRPLHNQILFSMDAGGNEHDQIYLLDLDSGDQQALTEDPKVIHRFGGFSCDGKLIAYASNRENGRDFYIYVRDLETGEERCVHKDANWNIAVGFSGDGSKLAGIKRKTNISNDLFVVDVYTTEFQTIASGEDGASHHSPQWIADGSGMYLISNTDNDFHCLDYHDFNTNETSRVIEPGWDVLQIALSKDNNHLAMTVNEGGYHRLRVYEAPQMKLLSLQCPQDGMNFIPRWSNDNSKLTFSSLSPIRTASAWILDMYSKDSWRVTPDHQDVPSEMLCSPSLIHYKSFDGLTVPSFLYTPSEETGDPMPVVIQIHGGPEGQSGTAFNPVVQYLVQNGYAVATPNVRGSSGYGKHYMALDDVEKRLDSVKDIVALRHYLTEHPEFDENKVVLSGGSYGGYMVLANLAFFPEYWAAGIDIVGISNLVSFLENTSVWRRALREAEYGSLERDREFLESVSPLNHANKITAPLMIIHGANDPRVPLSEAEQMYSVLRNLDRDVELIVYDDEGHGLSKRENRIDAWSKVVRFLDEHVKNVN